MIDNMVGIIFPLGWIRVYWSAKIGGEGVRGGSPLCPCDYGPGTKSLTIAVLQKKITTTHLGIRM